MFRPTAGAWLTHPIVGHGWVDPEAGVSPVGLRDKGFTMVSYPRGQKVWVLASACEDAPPPKGGKPRLVVARDEQECVQMPADCEA